MNPSWIAVAISILGLLSNGLWTVVNLRIENKILQKFDEFREWADERYVLKSDPAPARLTRRHV